ncbi:hypothetical protein C4A70_04581 [Escherichia coli]|nr:hypothetical protein C4A70_04581 [Escherichia coli]
MVPLVMLPEMLTPLPLPVVFPVMVPLVMLPEMLTALPLPVVFPVMVVLDSVELASPTPIPFEEDPLMVVVPDRLELLT